MIISTSGASQSPFAITTTDWRTAVIDLINWFVSNDRCFSSGEIAAYLRTFAPHLTFKVSSIGDYVRDQYDNGNFPSYGGSAYPTQVPRTCTGIARALDGRVVTTKTPVGQPVFVYAPDGAEGFAHDFEVFIPDWDDPQAKKAVPFTGAQPSVAMAAVTVSPPSPQVGILITGALSKDDVTAYVRPDRRLCVPRAAFEAFVALTGQPLRGGPQGDPVYVTFDGTKVRITRAATPTSQEYHLWVNRGRIAVANCPGGSTPGDKFKVAVSPTELVIDLSQKV